MWTAARLAGIGLAVTVEPGAAGAPLMLHLQVLWLQPFWLWAQAARLVRRCWASAVVGCHWRKRCCCSGTAAMAALLEAGLRRQHDNPAPSRAARLQPRLMCALWQHRHCCCHCLCRCCHCQLDGEAVSWCARLQQAVQLPAAAPAPHLWPLRHQPGTCSQMPQQLCAACMLTWRDEAAEAPPTATAFCHQDPGLVQAARARQPGCDKLHAFHPCAGINMSSVAALSAAESCRHS